MHATSSPKAIDLRPAILASLAAALFIAGIALGSVMDLGIATTPAAAVVAPDTSYTAVEGARSQFGAAPDTSYDTVESLRAQAGVAATTEFDVLHAARAKAAAAKAKAAAEDASLVGKSGYPSSRGTTAPTGTTAGAPVSQADPNDRYGAGIR